MPTTFRLAPLTNDHGDNPSPKSLLPVANKPMISFPLTWLEEAGVTSNSQRSCYWQSIHSCLSMTSDVLLICPYSHRSEIAHHVHSAMSSTSFSSLRIDIQTCEDDEAATLGTCSILRKFVNRIQVSTLVQCLAQALISHLPQNDFILLPCDFIPSPSLPLSVVLNSYRADTEGMIISTLFYEVKEEDKSSSEDAITPPLIVYDTKTGTLLHVDYSGDTEDELELHMRLLWR